MAQLRKYMCGGLRLHHSFKKPGMNGLQLLQSDPLSAFISIDPRLYFNRPYFLRLPLCCFNNLHMGGLPKKLPEEPEMRLTLLFFRFMYLPDFIIETQK